MLKTIRKLRKYFQTEIVGEKSAGQNGRKEFIFFFSFFICLSHALLGYIWDFPPIRHVQGKFSSNNLYALNMIFLELSRFLVLCGKLCFRMQGHWKGSSLWDRIYDSSRDRVHFPLHFLLHVLKSDKDCSKTFFLSFIQMSADSIKESNFCILPSSIVNPVGLEDRQTWRIQLPFISYVTLDKELYTSVPEHLIYRMRKVTMLVSWSIR